jgi:UDP-N-acetylmuramoylalanine--D-glutamate ligase
MSWQGKRVVILGAARQGTALTRWLIAQGARVTLSDMNATADLTGLGDVLGDHSGSPLRLVMGEHPLTLLDGCDVMCLSGGVPIDLPIVLEARRRGIPLNNDAQVFFEVCPAPIIGITGSAGKTTTTTLVGEILKWQVVRGVERVTPSLAPHNAPQVFVGGNIGNPLISDVDTIRPQDFVVMELSSFQLELMTRSPHIACITNITPNHLDRHGTMDAYVAAKRHIIDFQSDDDWQVLCADNDVTAGMNTHARTVWFSTRHEPHGDGAWLDDEGNLRLRVSRVAYRAGNESCHPTPYTIDAVICHRRELQLMGEHNILNVLAASAICAIAGASVEAMRAVATTFRGVAHRLQLVSDTNGVRWYDDSIATAPERLMAALKCFDQPVILLCGGRDKHLPWDEAAQMMVQRCKHIILFGEMGPLVADKVEDARRKTQDSGTSCVLHHSLHEAVFEAKAVAQPGDIVLLSPGGTSYDAFKDFAERGDRFRELILNQPTTQTQPIS